MTEGTKYHPLFEHLLFSGQGLLSMTFSEVESIIEAKLPPSAHTREEWWSNSPRGHSQARAWMRAGYQASKVDLNGKTVTFVMDGWPEKFHGSKVIELREPTGLGENAQASFDQAPTKVSESSGTKHPLFGIWKGKVTLLPDYDYSKPAYEADCLP
jgi:hypothetical protein